MKIRKMIATAAGAVLTAASGVLAMGIGDTTGFEYINIAWPAVYTNGVHYSTAATGNHTNGFDRLGYSGKAKLILFVSGDTGTAANTNTIPIVLQDSTATMAAGFTNVAGVTLVAVSSTSKVYTANVDLDTMKKYLRIGVTQSSLDNTNCSHTVGAVLCVTPKN